MQNQTAQSTPPTTPPVVILSSLLTGDLSSNHLQLNAAQEWYLRCVAQESSRLTNAILDVQRRQQERAQLMLRIKPELRQYLISLIQIGQDEYDFLCQQYKTLKASVWTTISSWQYMQQQQQKQK